MGIALVFAVQVALISWLSDPTPIKPRTTGDGPVLRLANTTPGELLPIEDPTLLVLPQQRSFSGGSWLTVPTLKFVAADWTETNRWLLLPREQLAAEFKHYVKTNARPSFPRVIAPEPQPGVPALPPAAPLSRASRLRLGGGLANRRLISPLQLPSWRHTDLLANSVVQALVDAHGNIVSLLVLLPGSGLKEADQHALELARTARFAPVEVTGPDRARLPDPPPTLGTMIFEWQTLPATNTPPAPP